MAEIQVTKTKKINKASQKSNLLYIKKHKATIEIICYKNNLNINKFDISNDCLSYSFKEETKIGVLKVYLSLNPKFKSNLFTHNTENISFKGDYNKFGMRFNYFFDRDRLQLGDKQLLIIKKDIITDHFICKVTFSTNASRLLKEAYYVQNTQSVKQNKQTVYGCYNSKCYSGGGFTPK